MIVTLCAYTKSVKSHKQCHHARQSKIINRLISLKPCLSIINITINILRKNNNNVSQQNAHTVKPVHTGMPWGQSFIPV